MSMILLQSATNAVVNEGLIMSISTIVGKLGVTGLLAFAIWYLDRRHRSLEDKRNKEKDAAEKKYDEITKRYDGEIRELDAKYDQKIENLTNELIVMNRKQSEVIEKNNGILLSLEGSINRLSDKLN